MNLNHWADGAWADGSWLSAWGESGSSPSVTQQGGGKRRRKYKPPRRWSDEALVPVQPEIIVIEAAPTIPALQIALEKRNRRMRLEKVISVALAYME